ncbi:hypothetical protein D6D27_05848 [Aureobasidium pullulans]|nr:hypothetical protein D6D27_05848 [Aureobasidium pullulans]
MVDYDHGSIGHSLRSAATSLRADTFPSVDEHSTTDYPKVSDIRHAVLVGEFWAAIYSNPGASNRLNEALRSNDTAAEYNANDALTFVYNGARYASTIQGYIEPNLRTLVSETEAENPGRQQIAEPGNCPKKHKSCFCTVSSYRLVYLEHQRDSASARTIYNTIGLVYPILMQFFFVLALNILCGQGRLFGRWSLARNCSFRSAIALVYTFIGAVCASALVFGFQDGWDLSAGQYFLAILVYWLYMHVDFLYTDVVTAFVPIKFVPFFIFSFVIFNVTSLLVPFELSPAFYRIGYVAPAHEAYQILIQIWSGGNHRLHQALPILFAWEVFLTPLAIFGMRRRCHAAAQMAKAG